MSGQFGSSARGKRIQERLRLRLSSSDLELNLKIYSAVSEIQPGSGASSRNEDSGEYSPKQVLYFVWQGEA
jgi:hypothetical protein